MQLTCFAGKEVPDPPSGYVYPFSLELLNHLFEDILINSVCRVDFLTFENTSDVWIIADLWSKEVDLWTMTIVGIRETDAEKIRDLLHPLGIMEAKRWLLSAHERLHNNPSAWLYESLTLRFEDDKLIWDPKEICRPGPRQRWLGGPPPRWLES